MCLVVKEGCKPEIASEDITCWKFVNMLRKDKWMAPIRGTLHDYDKVLIACDRLSVEPWHVAYGILHFVIEEGFHGYTNIDDAKNKANIFNAHTLVKCTIPKGAEYCLGPNGEIAATKMIVHKPKTE